MAEMSIGLEQEHSSIIHCYRCWLDRRTHCINLITEFFTSGNLRDYRQRHKHLELKAVKKWARQVGSAVSCQLRWSGSHLHQGLHITAAIYLLSRSHLPQNATYSESQAVPAGF